MSLKNPRNQKMSKPMMNDGIVLLAKQVNQTSFYSLNSVKKALATSKVGHTGTLDSFAQGLLVVCVGKMTRLAGNITEFDKSYEAVIQFGQETDTLEYTGEVIKEAPLPDLEKLKITIENHIGEQWQTPPSFSAIHVNGKRASDLARSGKETEIPKRKIKVFKAELEDYKLASNGRVLACKIFFSVSKGTYIRSLARDIALECESSGHLIGLYRTKVGNFEIQAAAGYQFLNDFTIDSCLQAVKEYKEKSLLKEKNSEAVKLLNNLDIEKDKIIKEEICKSLRPFDKSCAAMCGFYTVDLKNPEIEKDIKNGKKILTSWFCQSPASIPQNVDLAIFSQGRFCALISSQENKKYFYKFVASC